MPKHYINIGDRLEIHTKNDQDAKVYLSQVENVLDKDRIIINMPISQGKIIKLISGSTCSGTFFTGRGMYKHLIKIENHFVENGFNLTEIEILNTGEKFQRREFYRFDCAIPTKFSLLEKAENDDDKPSKVCDGVIKDICGGGMKFVTDEILEQNDKIKTIVVLDEDIVVTTGKILEKFRLTKGNYKYQYRIVFLNMEKHEREIIIQYIFEQQRKSIMKVR